MGNARPVVHVLEGLLFVMATATAAWGALDFALTRSLFSLWVCVLLLLMIFVPIIRRRLLALAARSGDVATVYVLEAMLYLSAIATVVVCGLELKRGLSLGSAWVLALMGMLFFWPQTRHRIIHGEWKRDQPPPTNRASGP